MTSSTLALTLLAVAALSAPSGTNAFVWPSWWPFGESVDPPMWSSLKTTFALDGFIPSFFATNATGYKDVPRTMKEALNKTWVSISGDVCDNGQFVGYRYIRSNVDTSIAALYDTNGIIAGLQMNIPVSDAKANPNNTYKFDQITMFQLNTINGVSYYTLTAYFIDPTTICTTGRALADLAFNGTGDRIVFQNGPTPATLITAPSNRTQAILDGWSDNKCFIGMGVHNWYQQETFDATNCDYIRPVFLLYTKEDTPRLLGFGFQFVGLSINRRFEQPPKNAVKMIVGPSVSQCLLQKASPGDVGVTTMHVFLIDEPGNQLCL